MVAAKAATAFSLQTNQPTPATFQPVSVYDTLPTNRLSEHFALREFIISAAAVRRSIDNTPPESAISNLTALCLNVLEPLRQRFGVIRVTSGYRCKEVNALVGGSKTSQHVSGEAADLHIGSMEVGRKMYDYIRTQLTFDQLIFERNRKTGARWLHVSYKRNGKNRMQAFEMTL